MVVCQICEHTDRVEIDSAMVSNPNRNQAVGERWGIQKDAVRRHRQHLSPALKAAVTRRESAGPRKALDRLEELHSRSLAILDAAEAGGQASLALNAVRELRGLVELLAKLTGELDERPTVQVLNVQSSPEWQQIRSAVVTALAPFPEAAQAVSRCLLELER